MVFVCIFNSIILKLVKGIFLQKKLTLNYIITRGVCTLWLNDKITLSPFINKSVYCPHHKILRILLEKFIVLILNDIGYYDIVEQVAVSKMQCLYYSAVL